MPREKLGEDLSESVLKIAQRRMSSEPIAAAVAAETPAVPLSKTIMRRLNNPRIWIWEAIIVAVAILLMVYNPNRNVPPAGRAERNIAMAPKAEEKPAAGMRNSHALAAKTAEQPEAGEKPYSDVEGPSMRAAPSPAAVEHIEALDVQIVRKKPSDTSGQSGLSSTENQPAAQGKTAGLAGTEKQPIAPAAAPTLEKAVEEAGKKVAAGRLEVVEDKSRLAESREAAPPGASVQAKADVEQKVNLDENLAKDTPNLATAKPAPPLAEKQSIDQAKAQAAPAQELLVVHCEITPQAVNNKAFDKVLNSNGIVWSETPVQTLSDDIQQQTQTFKSLVEVNSKQTASEAEIVRRSLGRGGNVEPAKTGPVDIIFVEAPPEQIKATINALAVQTNEFRTVSITPANSDYQVQQSAGGGNRRREAKTTQGGQGRRSAIRGSDEIFIKPRPRLLRPQSPM